MSTLQNLSPNNSKIWYSGASRLVNKRISRVIQSSFGVPRTFVVKLLNVWRRPVSQSFPVPKSPISVLIVTADNMTGELLKSAFARGRKDFAVETLTGSSQKVIGQLRSHKPQVALITE